MKNMSFEIVGDVEEEGNELHVTLILGGNGYAAMVNAYKSNDNLNIGFIDEDATEQEYKIIEKTIKNNKKDIIKSIRKML